MSSPQDNDTKETSQEELRARLADLTEKAAAKDAIRDYEAAAELYSQATEIQAQLNGEMAVENADLLYAYGKALYNVAVSKSDVLGSKITSETTAAQDKSKSAATKEGLIKAAISAAGSQGDLESAAKAQGNNKLFQFSGDENFEASDSEDEEEEGEQQEEEEDDEEEFENAYEVLDLARVLSLRKIEELEASSTDKGKGKGIAPEVRPIKERLANIYDLQAEISLEAEHFNDAVDDLRSALELKEALYPLEDPSVAECHYKLSLALEFASVERPGEGEEQKSADATKPTVVNTAMREEAVKHMETAIESCKLRMAQEEEKIKNGEISEEGEVHAARRKIENVKEIVSDMEQRVSIIPLSLMV